MNSNISPVMYSLLFLLAFSGFAKESWGWSSAKANTAKQVIVPGEDRFSPFALEIKVGDSVEWVNSDTDDHTVVSVGASNTTGPKRLNYVIPGTDNNGGKPGKLKVKFQRPGKFVYYCRFHSQLDSSNQPIAPGPDGGIQNNNGNYGTPMMGIIVVK